MIVILISGSSASAFPNAVDTAPAPSNKLARASEIPSVNAAVTLLAVAMALASAAVTKSLTVAVVPTAAVTGSVTNAAFTSAPVPVII